ncbi:MAG: hypothetical protein IJN18_06995 [Clostridia bacterium]|nr:hypothetical protein [Clostridia bacterium]
MKLIWKNFSRNKSITLAAVAAVAALTLFVLLYMNSIRIYQQELRNTYANMTVEGWIEGSKKGRAPVLTREEYTAVVESGFVANHSAQITCSGLSERGIWLYGLEKAESEPNLAAELSYVQWQEGWDSSLFGGSGPVCLAPRGAGLELGETMVFPLKKDSPEKLELTVVGLYGSYGGGMLQRFYCPLTPLREAFLAAGLSFNYSGLDLVFTDLENLETFKAAMLEQGLHTGEAKLRIDDTLMQQTTGQLKQQISLLQALLPVLLMLTAAIGFGLSFLLLRGRKKEAAILRSLGMRRHLVFVTLLAESSLQALTGSLLGTLAALLFAGSHVLHWASIAALLVSYLIGGAVAVWKLAGVNVFTVMTARE